MKLHNHRSSSFFGSSMVNHTIKRNMNGVSYMNSSLVERMMNAASYTMHASASISPSPSNRNRMSSPTRKQQPTINNARTIEGRCIEHAVGKERMEGAANNNNNNKKKNSREVDGSAFLRHLNKKFQLGEASSLFDDDDDNDNNSQNDTNTNVFRLLNPDDNDHNHQEGDDKINVLAGPGRLKDDNNYSHNDSPSSNGTTTAPILDATAATTKKRRLKLPDNQEISKRPRRQTQHNDHDYDDDDDGGNRQIMIVNQKTKRPSSSTTMMRRRKNQWKMMITPKIILDLPDDTIIEVFEFIGPHDFLYISGTCQKFARVYKTLLQCYNHNNNKKKNKTITITTSITSYHNMMESISRVKIYFEMEGNNMTNLHRVARKAACWGKLQILQYVMEEHHHHHHSSSPFSSLWENRDIVDSIRMCAVEKGQINILEYSKKQAQQNISWPNTILDFAAHSRQLDVIKWLLQKTDCVRFSNVCTNPTSKGDLDVLKCLRENGCPCDDYFCLIIAAAAGHLHVVKWMKQEQHIKWCTMVCENAAMNGHLELLKWSRQNGCPWNKTTCRGEAERNGHIDIVRWIDEN